MAALEELNRLAHETIQTAIEGAWQEVTPVMSEAEIQVQVIAHMREQRRLVAEMVTWLSGYAVVDERLN